MDCQMRSGKYAFPGALAQLHPLMQEKRAVCLSQPACSRGYMPVTTIVIGTLELQSLQIGHRIPRIAYSGTNPHPLIAHAVLVVGPALTFLEVTLPYLHTICGEVERKRVTLIHPKP